MVRPNPTEQVQFVKHVRVHASRTCPWVPQTLGLLKTELQSNEDCYFLSENNAKRRHADLLTKDFLT